jgi:hypothetical protein
MKTKVLYMMATLVSFAFIGFLPAQSDQNAMSLTGAGKGSLEIECNLSNVKLYLCPQDKFTQKEVRKFWGLVKSREDVCSEGELFIGTTPLKPFPLPAGKYVLLIPSAYIREQEGPLDISIKPGKKAFFMLKVFKKNALSLEAEHGEGGDDDTADADSGGSGSAGAVGTGAPE